MYHRHYRGHHRFGYLPFIILGVIVLFAALPLLKGMFFWMLFAFPMIWFFKSGKVMWMCGDDQPKRKVKDGEKPKRSSDDPFLRDDDEIVIV